MFVSLKLRKLEILGTMLGPINFIITRGGAVKYEMDTGVRAALRQAGAFSGSTGSKNEGSLGESMIFGI